MSYQPRTHSPSNPRTRSVFSNVYGLVAFSVWSQDFDAWPLADAPEDVIVPRVDGLPVEPE
jgi:hypothetical protein